MPSHLSPTELSLRAKIAAHDRHGHDAVADQYRQELAKVRTARDLDAHVARLAPALTDDQLDRLRSVLQSPPSLTRRKAANDG